MARSLEQIIAETDPGYAGSRATAQAQINALPGETQSKLEGLQATAKQSHSDILDSARGRGIGFSGIPIGEQVRYDSTTFKPAVANLYSAQNARKSSLEEALNGLFRDQRTNAMSIQQGEMDRDEQQRQFDQNLAFQREQMDRQERAAKAASAGNYLGGGGAGLGGGPQGATPGAAKIDRTANGGFNFFDGAGRPVSAAQYSQLTGVGYRQLLSKMASAGDANAKVALDYVGNDYKFGKPASGNIAAALRAVGATGNFINGSTVKATNFNAPLSARMGL